MHPSLLEAQALSSLQVHVHNQHTILPCFVTSSIRACMRQRRLAAAACRLNHPLIKAHPAETALMMLYMQLGFAPQLLLLLMLCLGAAESHSVAGAVPVSKNISSASQSMHTCMRMTAASANICLTLPEFVCASVHVEVREPAISDCTSGTVGDDSGLLSMCSLSLLAGSQQCCRAASASV